MKLYCPNCGAENFYSVQKPEFCKLCKLGMAFSGIRKVPKVAANPEPVIESETEKIETSPEMFKIDIIGGEHVVQKQKLEDVMKQKKTGFVRPKGNMTQEQVWSEIKATAKTTRIEEQE